MLRPKLRCCAYERLRVYSNRLELPSTMEDKVVVTI